jgi:flagellar hook-length control protein FliK
MPSPNGPAPSLSAVTAAESTAAASSPEESVPQQLLTVLNPLRTGDDGSQFVTMALQPEGLGNVQATVTIAGEQVTVSLWAESASGHAALSQTMSQLHSQLSDGSDHQVTVDLADFGSAQPDARNGHAPGGHGAAGTPAQAEAPLHDYLSDQGQVAQPVPLSGGRRVDLRL